MVLERITRWRDIGRADLEGFRTSQERIERGTLRNRPREPDEHRCRKRHHYQQSESQRRRRRRGVVVSHGFDHGRCYLRKMGLGIMAWIPLVPSTTWVTTRSIAALASR